MNANTQSPPTFIQSDGLSGFIFSSPAPILSALDAVLPKRLPVRLEQHDAHRKAWARSPRAEYRHDQRMAEALADMSGRSYSLLASRIAELEGVAA